MTLPGMIRIGIKRLKGMIKDLLRRRLFHLNQLVPFGGRVNHKRLNGKSEFKKNLNLVQKKVKISQTHYTLVLLGSAYHLTPAPSGTRL